MAKSRFVHYNLKLVEPDFGSSLTDLIIDLDYLRKKSLEGSTHPMVFFQLKNIFHLLESIGSARIEGNNTTLAEYIDAKSTSEDSSSKDIKEIANIENSMEFIEDQVLHNPINQVFVSELHKKVVKGLKKPPLGGGDPTPGAYRSTNLEINHSAHKPPEHVQVRDYMDELFAFIEKNDSPKYDLIKTAIAHHRFVWIHPFRNGNGRTVRLLTYAMLVKQGFNLNKGRIVNPTAIFCSDRDAYYSHLALADKGTKAGILTWCEYVLVGLKQEIEKINKLCDYKYLQQEILLPSVDYAEEMGNINPIEAQVLKKAIPLQRVQANDLKSIFHDKSGAEISRQIRRLKDRKLLVPEEAGKRKYTICLTNSPLMRAVIHRLGVEGFLPINDRI